MKYKCTRIYDPSTLRIKILLYTSTRQIDMLLAIHLIYVLRFVWSYFSSKLSFQCIALQEESRKQESSQNRLGLGCYNKPSPPKKKSMGVRQASALYCTASWFMELLPPSPCCAVLPLPAAPSSTTGWASHNFSLGPTTGRMGWSEDAIISPPHPGS